MMDIDQIIKHWLKNTNEKLDLSGKNIKKWPSLLKGKNELIVHIDVFNNELKYIPPLPNLITGDFSENIITRLSRIPNIFAYIHHLL